MASGYFNYPATHTYGVPRPPTSLAVQQFILTATVPQPQCGWLPVFQTAGNFKPSPAVFISKGLYSNI